MEQFAYIVVLVTTGTVEEANKIAAVLLEQRKAACVNIVPRVNSRFWWQGELDSAEESLLIVKTRASLLDEVASLVKEAHSYDVAEVIALPIVGGNRDYLDWMDKELVNPRGSRQ